MEHGNNYDCWNAPTDIDPTFEYEHGESSSSASASDFSTTSSSESEASDDNPVRYYICMGMRMIMKAVGVVYYGRGVGVLCM